MPSPERPPGGERKEAEPLAYHRAARFPGEQPAGLAYSQAQKAIYKARCDLSVFRLQIDYRWHVALVGEQPEHDLEQQLQTILASGEAVTLSADILKLLGERRAHAKRLGPWVERHHRPGKRL